MNPGNPAISRPLKRDRRAFTRDGISVIKHIWLYGDTELGHSIKKGDSKFEVYVWDTGFVVDRSDYENEMDARLYAYRDMKRRGWDLEPASEEQAEVEERGEDGRVAVYRKEEYGKPSEFTRKTFTHKELVEGYKKEYEKIGEKPPVMLPKPPVEIENELSALKKQEMKYYREEVAAKDYASKIEAYGKRLVISKKIKRLTRPPRLVKPVLTVAQKQLDHESKQIARIQKLDARIETQMRMDAELKVLKKEYDPEEVDGKDPVLFERRVERHRAKLKSDISSLKQDKNVSIADNKIKYDGEYVTYTHRLTEEEFKAIK